jgi:uracil-DNA glycosylase family 4
LLAKNPEDPLTSPRQVKPRPVLSASVCAPIMLLGQAPGLTEYRTGQPFSGQAGNSVRQLFGALGVPSSEFDRAVYQTSAVKCFPGRKLNKGGRSEDRPPCATMHRHCRSFLSRQIELVDPRLIITLGGAALAALDRLRGLPKRRLWEVVGTSENWGATRIVSIGHTSGANRSLNDAGNRAKQDRAFEILRRELLNQRISERG